MCVCMHCLARTRIAPRNMWQCGKMSSLYCCNALLLMTAFICCIDDYFLSYQVHTALRPASTYLHPWLCARLSQRRICKCLSAHHFAVAPALLRFFAYFFSVSMYVCRLPVCFFARLLHSARR